jgi:hypothetical protein
MGRIVLALARSVTNKSRCVAESLKCQGLSPQRKRPVVSPRGTAGRVFARRPRKRAGQLGGVGSDIPLPLFRQPARKPSTQRGWTGSRNNAQDHHEVDLSPVWIPPYILSPNVPKNEKMREIFRFIPFPTGRDRTGYGEIVQQMRVNAWK